MPHIRVDELNEELMREPAWLLDYADNVFSQAGEDGVIAQILAVLPQTDKWCVEFGAWDGIYLSNSRNLILNANYSAVLIEGNSSKAADLANNYADRPNVHTVNSFVGFSEQDGLDSLLAQTPIPEDFDVLSIDVDGNDYHIWQAVQRYRPKVVCVEYNPTIASEVSFVQEPDPQVMQGASIKSLVDLANEKGYQLVCALAWNAFFVDAKYFPLFNITDNSIATLRRDLTHVAHYFVGYDGTAFLRGADTMLWHQVPLRESAVQPLPKFLRKFPSNYTPS